MKTVRIKTKGITEESVVVCRRNVLAHLPVQNAFLFTDENVYRIYKKKIDKLLGGVPVHVMPAGEEHKTAETLFALLEGMASAGLRRNSCLIALGGGVVGDIGGLAASLYMRGISCMQVPTTLLAQVDSSVGGKTAVDFCGVKNLIGAFKQPINVFADPAFLATLPLRELRCGLGEIVKHGALCPSIFEKLWENRENLFDLEFLAEIVPENIAFKASVVRQDPYEAGLRKSLNLGHTTAHALELSGCTLSHGECVALGMILESAIAQKYCACDTEFLGRLKELCLRVLGGLPELSAGLELKTALLDKKNTAAGKVVLTAPVAAGKYELLELPFEEYLAELGEIRRTLC